MKQIKVSFDFDGTLSTEIVQKHAKELIKKGYEVWIVTSRFSDIMNYTSDFLAKYQIDNLEEEFYALFDIASEIGIKEEHIHFTNMEDKYKFFCENTDFLFHLDNDSDEIRDINEFTVVEGVYFSHNSSWKRKCNKIIKNEQSKSNNS